MGWLPAPYAISGSSAEACGDCAVISVAVGLIAVLLPVLGLVCVGTGVWWIRQGGLWSGVALIAYTTCGVACAVFAPEDARFLDHLLGIPGLGRLTLGICAPIGVALQGALAARLEGTWTKKDWRSVTLAVAPVAPLLLLWPDARVAAGGDVSRLLYDGYYGHPPALLAWNIALGCAALCACVVTIALHLRHQDATKDSYVLALVAVYSGGVIYGLLIILSALTNGLFGASVAPWQVASMAVFPLALLVAVSQTFWVYAIYPAGRLLRLCQRLDRTRGELTSVRDELVALLLVQVERLVALGMLDGCAGPDAVARRCCSDRVPLAPSRVALQAARWIAYRRAMIRRRAAIDGVGTAPALDEVDSMIVGEAAAQLRNRTYFDADVCQVIICALGRRHVPAHLGELPPPQPWHAILANYLIDPCAAAPWPRDTVGRRAASWVRACGCLPGHVHLRLSPARLQAVVDVLQQDVEDLALQCYERLAHLRNYIDDGLIEEVDDLCRAHNLPPDESDVAREVARWSGLFEKNELRAAPLENAGAGGRGAGEAVTTAPAGGVPTDGSRYAHTMRILTLGLAHVPREIAPRRPPQRWHQTVWGLIERAMTPDARADVTDGTGPTARTASTDQVLAGARADGE